MCEFDFVAALFSIAIGPGHQTLNTALALTVGTVLAFLSLKKKI